MHIGQVAISSSEFNVTVVGWLTKAPKTSGFGGWDEIARPRRKPLSNFAGAPARRQQLEILFDGHATDTSVDGERNALKRLAQPAADDGTPPPLVRLAGALEDTDLTYYIESIEWGDEIRRSDGAYTRQAVSVVVTEFTGSNTIQRSRTKLHRVRKGDTLYKISKRYYGTTKRWKEIKQLNPGVRGPRRLTLGQILRLP